MSEVFLSYKREADTERANVVYHKLTALGVQVFIDQTMSSGTDFQEEIEREIAGAKAILVLWTKGSIKSRWVRGEALHGLNRDSLVAAVFDDIAPQNLPSPFNTVHTPDLSDWIETGARGDHKEWQSVLDALGHSLDRPSLPNLARTLDDGSDEAKRKFLQVHPDDPYSQRFATALEEIEQARTSFEERMLEARKRVKTWFRKAEARLKESRDEFDRRLIELRAGRHFEPPDPVTALDQNVAKLRDDIEAQQVALKDWQERTDHAEKSVGELRARAEQAQASAEEARRRAEEREKSAAQAFADVARQSDEIETLRSQIKKLSTRRGEVDKLRTEGDALQQQLASRDAALAGQGSEIAALRQQIEKAKSELEDRARDLATLSEAAAEAKADFERKQGEIGALQEAEARARSELEERIHEVAALQEAATKAKAEADDRLAAITELQSRSTDARGGPRRLALAAGVALVLGLSLGALAYGIFSNDGATNLRLTGENEALVKRVGQITKDRDDLLVQLREARNEKQALIDRIRQLSDEKVELESQIKQLIAKRATLETQIEQLAEEKTSRDARIKQLADDVAAGDNQIKQLTAGKAALDSQIKQLIADKVALDSRIKQLIAEKTVLESQIKQLTADKAALDSQIKQLTADRTARDSQIKQLTEEMAARDGQIKQLTADKASLDDKVKKSAVADAVAQCDLMTAYQLDQDKPSTSGWKDHHWNIDVDAAWKNCKQAADMAGDIKTQRRLKLQLGRIFAGSGHKRAEAGDFVEAERQFGYAVSYWNEAADLGSAHAFTVLGNYYQGTFSVKKTPRGEFVTPQPKQLPLAWQKYLKAAEFQNPIGLATVGYGLLFPDWGDWKSVVPRSESNERKGREYLESASRWDHPNTLYYMGMAIKVAVAITRMRLRQKS